MCTCTFDSQVLCLIACATILYATGVHILESEIRDASAALHSDALQWGTALVDTIAGTTITERAAPSQMRIQMTAAWMGNAARALCALIDGDASLDDAMEAVDWPNLLNYCIAIVKLPLGVQTVGPVHALKWRELQPDTHMLMCIYIANVQLQLDMRCACTCVNCAFTR